MMLLAVVLEQILCLKPLTHQISKNGKPSLSVSFLHCFLYQHFWLGRHIHFSRFSFLFFITSTLLVCLSVTFVFLVMKLLFKSLSFCKLPFKTKLSVSISDSVELSSLWIISPFPHTS